MRLLALASLVLTLGCATARGEPAQPSFVALEGAWIGEGVFQGAPSEVSATFAPLFDGSAWNLDIDIRMTPPNRPAARFRGRGGYVVRDGAPEGGAWIDSAGNAYAITPRFENGALVVDWGQGSVAGRSTYRLDADGGLHIEDAVRGADGRFRAFATASLRRGH